MIKKDKPKKNMRRARRAETAFYVSIVALPFFNYVLLNFIPGYFYIFVFATQKYQYEAAKYVFQRDIFYNFRWFLDEFFNTPGFAKGIANSFLLYGIGWLTMPISLFVSYYITKKMPGAKVFKVILMMPGMISGMVWVLLYKYFVERAMPLMFGWPMGLLSNVSTQLAALIAYGLWLGLAGNMLLYTGILSGVSDAQTDAGKVDGLGVVGEFWHISMPTLYPVWMVGVIGGIAGFFSSSPGTFEFFGFYADKSLYTIGYLMFTRVMSSGSGVANYGFNAAGSILFSLVVMPITLTGKWALERYGPSEETREPIRWFWKRRKSV